MRRSFFTIGMYIAILLLLCTGCGQRVSESQSKTFFAMDTVMSVSLYGGDAQIINELRQEVTRLEKLLSVTDANSPLYSVNQQGSGQMPEEGVKLIEEAMALGDRTGGALDITIYPVLRAWGFTTEETRKPDQTELDALLPQVDYQKIGIKGDKITLPEGAMLDLGAVAKGYTADRLTELLKEAGVEDAIFDLGGNVQLVGDGPSGSGWRVGVGHPDGTGYLGVLVLSDKAAVTSGGYQRYFEEDGETYHHIIDPATGYPAKAGLASVTVVADGGLTADGLSTALYVMGLEEATELWRQSDDFEAVFYTEDGQLYITEGLEGSFEPEKIQPVVLRRTA